ncbi:MAG: hypothetical protein KDK70_34060 [Myxococcales bacterium]|nr:hypothetical protein [Myxococcales bacterium]
MAGTPGPEASERPASQTSGPASPEPEPPTTEVVQADGEPLLVELTRWRGEAPALLVSDRAGLSITDGSRTRVLVEAKIDLAGYDPAHRIVWYVVGSELRALDLMAPAGSPVVVARPVPPDTSISLSDASLWLGEERVPEYLVVRWSVAPPLELGLSFDEVMNEDVAEAVGKVGLVDAPWFEALAKRAPRPVPRSPATTAVHRAPVVECDSSYEACRRGVAWPHTRWVLYVTEYDCGDYCYFSCGLFDPKTGHTADPSGLPRPTWDETGAAFSGSCGPYHTDVEQRAFAIEGRLCGDHGCTPIEGQSEGQVLGFLEPGPRIFALGPP